MKTKSVIKPMKQIITRWRRLHRNKNPDVWIHYVSGKTNPFQGYIWLLDIKTKEKAKICNFHSAGELVTALETILKLYPLCG